MAGYSAAPVESQPMVSAIAGAITRSGITTGRHTLTMPRLSGATAVTVLGTRGFIWPEFDRWQGIFAASGTFPARWKGLHEVPSSCMSSAVSGYVKTLGADAPPACYADIDHAACLFIAGSNTAFAHPVLFRRLEAAQERIAAQRPGLVIAMAERRAARAAGD